MFKVILSVALSVFFTSFLYSQNNFSQQYIEENGDGINTTETNYHVSHITLGWTSLPDAPEPFGRSIGGTIGDFVYVFCGQANSSMAAAYKISTNTWSASTVPNSPGYNCGFVVAGGELYKISGTGSVSVMEKFTPDGTGTGSWTALTGGPTDIMNAQNSATWDGGDYIYVHSSNYSSTTPESFLSRYSISGNSWSTLTPTTIIKRYPGLVYHNGYLYLIGGLVPTGGDQTECVKYDIATDTWSSIAPLPEAVNFCKWTTTVVGNQVVLVGSGGGYTTYPANPKIFYYDIAANTWTYDSDTPAIRGLALAFYLPSLSKVFFGGGNEGGSSTNYQASCWNGDGGFVPVELTSFSASVSGNVVLLNWQTVTETNNSGFEIERSEDNQNFSQIGFVPGSGTSTEPRSYNYSDNMISSGKYYYRLKQIDYDGSFEYSNVVEAEIGLPSEFRLEQNYPNPFNPSTIISFQVPNSSFVNLKVYDALGNEIATLVNEEKSTGSYEVNFRATNLSSGIYLYHLQAGSFVETKKMLLMK